MQTASGYDENVDDGNMEDKVPNIIEEINEHTVEAFFSAKDSMIQMELDLPERIVVMMQDFASNWSKSFNKKIDTSDALSILLTKMTNADFEKIAKNVNNKVT